MSLAKLVLSYHDCTVSVLDKEVCLTAPIAEYKRLTFFGFDGSTSGFSWNNTVTLSWLLSIPDIDERVCMVKVIECSYSKVLLETMTRNWYSPVLPFLKRVMC